ncbi:hypothetical protein BGW38_000465 [Lunasporangiospora selenospora]|uniref:Uncharacterized protein n=1 Tax=Lunasporangiospora selenospora TaxID=979761 RepID=A0A9P6FVA1_9FUNG|nr:hypothetical protein BGW38_000465 [Lunasporangiospora selenospora]
MSHFHPSGLHSATSLSASERLAPWMTLLTPSVSLNLLFGAYHLMGGLLLGILKYYQIYKSKTHTAHPYTSAAHRASLMYGYTSLQMAAMAALSSWSEPVNMLSSIAPQFFFVTAVANYGFHGLMKDTTNAFKTPHRVGDKFIPSWVVHSYMAALIPAEVAGCGVLAAGMTKTLYQALYSTTR